MSDYDVAGALASAAPAEASPTGDTNLGGEAVAQQSEAMFDLKWGGETQQFPQSKMVQYAQQGYDYNKKMSDINSQRTLLDQERNTFQTESAAQKERYSYLDQVDQYAQQNPQWLQNVQNSYAQATGNQAPGTQAVIDQTNPLAGTVNSMQEQMQEMQGTLKAQADREQAVQQAEEDKQLSSSIGDYKKAQTSFDWEAQDPSTGQTLEQQILDHAMQKGATNFQMAANDFLFDRLMQRANGQGKEAIVKDIQQKTLLGLGPVTNAPTQCILQGNVDTNKSYSQLAAEAMAEIGG